MDKPTFEKLLSEEKVKTVTKHPNCFVKSNLSWFEVVHVIKRSSEGIILEWYPGDDKFKTKEKAAEDLADLNKGKVKGDFVIVEINIKEV